MHCDNFEERIQELLDQRFDPTSDTLLRVHAERCPACRELLGGYGSISVLERRPRLFASTVAAGRPKSKVARWSTAGAMVAAALGAILFASGFPASDERPPVVNAASVAASVSPSQLAPPQQETPSESLLQLASGGGTVPATDLESAAAFDAEMIRDFVTPLADAAGVAAATGGASLAQQTPLAPSVAGLALPIAKPFTAAWGVFRRALAGSQDAGSPRRAGLKPPQAQLLDLDDPYVA